MAAAPLRVGAGAKRRMAVEESADPRGAPDLALQPTDRSGMRVLAEGVDPHLPPDRRLVAAQQPVDDAGRVGTVRPVADRVSRCVAAGA